MRNKESPITVMVAVMLIAASLFGGYTMLPAFATHPDATQVIIKQFTKDDDETTNIDAVELAAKKSILRATGTITIEVIQNGNVLDSATLSALRLTTTYTTHEVPMGVRVEGSFEILVEYAGSGSVQANSIKILEGTEPDETPRHNTGETGGGNKPNQLTEREVENVVARKTIPLEDDESLDVETVEFKAKKSILRATGTITVAIVQDGKVLDADSMSTNGLSTTYSDREASFDIKVTGEFEVVIMYDGSGSLQANSINVPGATEPAEEEPTTPPNNPPPTGTNVKLTVNAIDQAGSEVVGMWIEVYSGMSTSGKPLFTGETPETFELEQGDYIVAVADFENYVFQGWDDSSQDRTREVTLTKDETFTAVYSTTGGSQPPQDPPTPPPSAGSGSIVVFAHRIPSQHWGPTFTSAGVGMWYVLYNSTGWLVGSGFYDEEGTTITGLNDGETYYVYATDCDECHGDPHDVVFDHWEDMTTENPRAVTTGDSAHAYYRYEPDP
ncbi:MAG TPA: hypothetical protein VNI77_05435 [Nitrososphaera sp.]|nr:hypothetical protein [Nitrososphaera sp.]